MFKFFLFLSYYFLYHNYIVGLSKQLFLVEALPNEK